MKLIISTATALLLAGQAFAGALVFEAPVEEEIIVAEPAPAPPRWAASTPPGSFR
jgi:hypothetical protein